MINKFRIALSLIVWLTACSSHVEPQPTTQPDPVHIIEPAHYSTLTQGQPFTLTASINVDYAIERYLIEITDLGISKDTTNTNSYGWSVSQTLTASNTFRQSFVVPDSLPANKLYRLQIVAAPQITLTPSCLWM